MHRFTRLLSPVAAFLALASTTLADVPDSIAVYMGTEKITSIGGGNTNSSPGSSTGKRRQPVYIAIDTNFGTVQRVRLRPSVRKYHVEDPVEFAQVFPQTGGRRSKEHVRLMVVNHTEPQPGEFTNAVSIYDGRTLSSVMNSSGLSSPYPRVLKWTFAFQYSGFEVAPPAVTTYPQIDTGTAVLSLNKALTKASAGKTLSATIDVITGALAQRRYSPEP